MAAQRKGVQRSPGDLRQLRGRGATAPRPFPSPSDHGPGCLMGSPAPPPGSQRLVEALELLGRHGDALEARVPSAQHQGLNLHNLPLRGCGWGWGWGPARPWPGGRGGLGCGQGSLCPPLPSQLWVQVQSRTGTTWYSPDSDPGALVQRRSLPSQLIKQEAGCGRRAWNLSENI